MGRGSWLKETLGSSMAPNVWTTTPGWLNLANASSIQRYLRIWPGNKTLPLTNIRQNRHHKAVGKICDFWWLLHSENHIHTQTSCQSLGFNSHDGSSIDALASAQLVHEVCVNIRITVQPQVSLHAPEILWNMSKHETHESIEQEKTSASTTLQHLRSTQVCFQSIKKGTPL